MGYILSLPFVYEGYWGWGTIPAVAAVAFALLGIEGAATECENPFSPKRTNHLGMDGFCEATQREIMELLSWWRLEEQ
jgi:putative membrane protein